jgi:hypothetical protein
VGYRRSIHDLLRSQSSKGIVRIVKTKSLGRTVKNGAPHCYLLDNPIFLLIALV